MKKLIYVILFQSLLCGFGADADSRANIEIRATHLKEQLLPFLFKLPGVHGVGIVACNDHDNGNSNSDKIASICVGIYVDESGYPFVSGLYPKGTQINGIYLRVKQAEPAVIQPRISGGN